MKLSKVILMLNELSKKHGDVEVIINDDNNGGYKEFNAYYDEDKIIKPGEYAQNQTLYHHKGLNCIIID